MNFVHAICYNFNRDECDNGLKYAQQNAIVRDRTHDSNIHFNESVNYRMEKKYSFVTVNATYL